jgi:hypothetical protein
MTPNDLLKVNVNDHTEKKNGLTYLSWAWAWAKVLEIDPTAAYKVEVFPDSNGMLIPYMRINESSMVWVTVTVFGKPMTVQLPVLDYRNKCIPVPNAFDINTSIMRCLVKGIAMHGLGLYIYAGEDLPMQDEAVKVTHDEPVKVINIQETAEAEFKGEQANDELFANGMIEYSIIVQDLKSLNSYWKANQTALDKLKVTSPDLYTKVRDTFSTLKATFTKE